MTIRYSNGQTVEAILLSRTSNSMRAAMRGSEEVVEFFDINGIWVTEHCEPVEVEFAWMRHADVAEITETDCICPPELAARLLHLLFSGEDAPKPFLVCSAGAGSAEYLVS
jgi:hypothetical protein